ncbi:MAG: hypothetical protein IMZ67_05520 [Acidobacteria bacterium]|nr:hypothetical protein [Acidobacteriota bacterium]
MGIARRRLLNAEQGFVPLAGRSAVSTDALSLLLRGTVDEIALTELVSGLSLLPSWALRPPAAPRVSVEEVDAIMPWFGLLRAVCSPRILAVEGRHPSPPVISAILAHLAAWDLAGALTLAERRLRASGCRLLAPLRAVSRDQDCTAVAAALVIPLPDVVEHTVVARVVDPSTWPSASKEVSRACV